MLGGIHDAGKGHRENSVLILSTVLSDHSPTAVRFLLSVMDGNFCVHKNIIDPHRILERV